MTTFHIITLFPESLESYLKASILKRAQEDGFISIKYYNPRDFAIDPKDLAKMDREPTYSELRVDNKPYGGGPGMVMEALPVMRAIQKALNDSTIQKLDNGIIKKRSISNNQYPISKGKVKIIFFSPSGTQFTNEVADKYKKYTDIVLVCGRYEGIDARVKKAFPMVDISVGPFVLTGGELPAMIVIDSISRRIKGVLGDHLSIEESRIASPEVYTRPEVIEFKGKKFRVPKILLSGHHARMDEWRGKIKGKKRSVDSKW